MGFNKSIPQLVAVEEAKNEYRGHSYSIGGDKDAFTIPNYIGRYQPNVMGASVGAHPIQLCDRE